MYRNRFQIALAVLPCAAFLACGSDSTEPAVPVLPSAGAAGSSAGSGGLVAGAGGAVAGAAGAALGGGGTSSAGAGVAGAVTTPCSARPGLLFCDDFESTSELSAPWSIGAIGEGTVTLEDGPLAHSGRKAVHVRGTEYQTLLVYRDPALLPRADGKLYVRAYLRLAEPMTGGHNTFVIADTVAAPNAGNALRVGEQNAMLMMTVGGDAHGYLSNQNFYNDGKLGAVISAEKYACLELFLDAPNTEIRVWLDGSDVTDLHVTDLPHENYDQLRFGFEKYAGPVRDIWYDDIAIGSERIGCEGAK